ncbi:MAG: hypothetical protein PQJ59_17505 [Spirochaetales bacterium]|nr:hypothetical protein [Spirochaetales bacterium]
MKRLILFIITMLPLTSLWGEGFQWGLGATVGTAIGTGKGNWDWTDPSEGIQRETPLNGGLSLLFLLDGRGPLQLESGIGYYWNRTEIRNGDMHRSYEQDTIEVPLALRIFLNPEKRKFYIKGGGSLMYLCGPGRFLDGETGENYFTDDLPDNQFHGGLQFGTGRLFSLGKRTGQIELSYITFYSSPDYMQTDGTLSDMRFHRIAVVFGTYF